jgi:acyl carrier protein
MDIGEVTLEMSYEDMGHDSLSAIEFLIACEDTFDITVPDNIATGFHTLEDLVEYIYDNY